MLTRARILVMTTIGCLFSVVLVATPATAGGGTGSVDCTNQTDPRCTVNAGTPGQPGTSGSSYTGSGVCRDPLGVVIPCQRDGWAGSDGCYYKPLDISPGSAGAMGQPAGPGQWYLRTCYSPNGMVMAVPVWLAIPPVVTPQILARQVLRVSDLEDGGATGGEDEPNLVGYAR